MPRRIGSPRDCVPELSKDPANWLADAMRSDRTWEVRLDDSDRAEIAAAVAISERRGEPMHGIDRASFCLPRLAPKLERLRRDVVDGRGFAMLRGFDVGAFDRAGIVRAFFGIGAHLGTARSQNGAGHLIGHVRDLGEDPRDPAVRLYRTRARQRFHVDSCDVVGLLCLQKARAGGESFLCSSLAIVAAIGAQRPDLLAVLERPFPYDRKGEVPAGKGPWYSIPIVHRHRGSTSVYFARDFIESAQRRFPEAPRLSPLQVEALDMVERLAESDAFRLAIAFEPGDLQFVHNHVLLHSRAAYEDGPEPGQKRHLLRLWLSAHDPRPLPPQFAERYGPLVDGQPRGGIHVPGVAPKVPLEPE